MMLKNFLIIISLSILLFVVGYTFPENSILKNPEKNKPAQNENVEPIIQKQTVSLRAKSACVFDIKENKFLFELNSGRQMPLASLTKLMTALVARESFPETTLVEITSEAISKDGDEGLKVSEKWKLKDITDIMLIASSNDAASAIAGILSDGTEPNNIEFIKLMNKKAQELNLQQSYYLDASGLDISEQIAGGYGSCYDVTKLTAYILKNHPDLLEITTHESLSLDDREFKNTNQLLAKLPLLLGGKTGYDDLAGGNLTVTTNKGLNHPIIVTVLGSTREERFTDVEELYNVFVK